MYFQGIILWIKWFVFCALNTFMNDMYDNLLLQSTSPWHLTIALMYSTKMVFLLKKTLAGVIDYKIIFTNENISQSFIISN